MVLVCLTDHEILHIGSDPSYGLPGVTRPRQLIQPVVTVGKRSFTWSLPDSSGLVSNSKWNTRAWTYQEMVFSNRWLIFTDVQVYWTAGETLYRLEACPVLNYNRFGNDIMNGASNVGNPWQLLRHIETYSKRQLTYHSDIIRGMQGIFEAAICEGKIGSRHFWGLPMQLNLSLENDNWCFYRNMFWVHTECSERQPNFPSWSWTGWKGAVTFGIDDYKSDLYTNNYGLMNVLMYVENREGDSAEWDFVKAQIFAGVTYNNWTYILFFEGYITQLSFVWLSNPPPRTSDEHLKNKWEVGPGIFIKCHEKHEVYSPIHVSGSYGGEDSELLSGRQARKTMIFQLAITFYWSSSGMETSLNELLFWI